jgi:hypothetical protein
MEQTAVDWLIDKIEKHYIINNGILDPTVIMELKRQAKEMEKQQIINASATAYEDMFGANGNEYGENYYNKH